MRQLGLILVTIFFFNACTDINEYTDSYKFKYLHSTSVTNFSNIVESALDDVSMKLLEIKSKQSHTKPLYVTDFVNLKELENHSELGFMLSDELKTLVTQKLNWPVHGIEYTKYLKIGANGTKLLSRDLDELKNKTIDKNSIALVGTYSFTQRQLILYLKVINLKNGVILKSSTSKTELTDEIIHLEKKARYFDSEHIYKPMVL
ncbi:MAG: FlgO family outer membrane protein [Campylobacterota bacterium]|nr:FlgO family outer membrane protein [Campylobacterota bacterium]